MNEPNSRQIVGAWTRVLTDYELHREKYWDQWGLFDRKRAEQEVNLQVLEEQVIDEREERAKESGMAGTLDQERKLDATDYLKTPDAQAAIDVTISKVMREARDHPEKYHDRKGWFDPHSVRQEINRQVKAAEEDLLADLPDAYLSPEELAEREQRLAESGWPDEDNWPEEGDWSDLASLLNDQ